MATYLTTDFADFDLAGDWTRHWETPSTDWAVSSGVLSAQASAGGFAGVSWDDAADDDDVDILILAKQSNLSSRGYWAYVRGSGAAGSPQCYAVALFSSSIRIYKFTGSESGTSLGSATISLSNDTYYWVRFRVNSDDLTAKVWAVGGSEGSPIGTVTVTNDTSITGSGWAGPGPLYVGSYTVSFDQYGIGTNGDTAPASASSATTISVGTASITVTPTNTTIVKNKAVSVNTASITVTPTNLTISQGSNIEISVSTASISVTPVALTIEKNKAVSVSTGTITVTPTALTIDQQTTGETAVNVIPVTILVTKTNLSINQVRAISVTTRSITATPNNLTIVKNKIVAVSTGLVEINPTDLTIVQAGPTTISVTTPAITITPTNLTIINEGLVWTTIVKPTSVWSDVATASSIWTEV